MSITLNTGQAKAVLKLKNWYLSQDDLIFTIAGLAGTGKSTIVNVFMNELNISQDNAALCCFTGKAALVLNQKGNRATTIHKLIYDTEIYTTKDPKTGLEIQKVKFSRKPFLSPNIKIIIVDEVSTVSENILNDLKKFNIPIIALGDSGQLPPISKANSLLDSPDVFLTEIMRQALDNPIIYLSMLAREKKRIDLGSYKDSSNITKVAVINEDQLTDKMLLKANQIICGSNDTRQDINHHMRDLLQYEGLPQVGDKLICTRNNWDITASDDTPLINGLTGFVTRPIENPYYQNGTFDLSFRPEHIQDNSEYISCIADLTPFISPEDAANINPRLRSRGMTTEGMKINYFDFGYAITCHKSQGSQFDNLLVYEEILNRRDHHKWLYTAITRSANKLILVKR